MSASSPSAPTDSLGQPIDEGDFVVYASGSRTAGSSGRIGRVIGLKKKVRVQFHKADGAEVEPLSHDSTWAQNYGKEWLAAESLVVVTALKTWKPKVSA